MANLLKISATVTETKSVNKNVELPYYFKNSYGNSCKVVSKEFFLTVIPSAPTPLVCVNYVEYNKDVIAKGTPITADEYEAAYSQAMMYVDLINRNEEPSREKDVNEEIDQIREAS